MSDTPTPDNPGLLNWFLIIFLGVIWGAAFMAIGTALEGYGPRLFTASRLAGAAILLNILGAFIGQPITAIHKTAGKRGWLFISLIGTIALAMPLSMLSWGQQHVPSAFAGVAMSTVPILVLPLVYIFSPEEGIGPRRVIGMIIGFVGLIVLVGPGAFFIKRKRSRLVGSHRLYRLCLRVCGRLCPDTSRAKDATNCICCGNDDCCRSNHGAFCVAYRAFAEQSSIYPNIRIDLRGPPTNRTWRDHPRASDHHGRVTFHEYHQLYGANLVYHLRDHVDG